MSWTDAGFPDKFRFRTHTALSLALGAALFERETSANGDPGMHEEDLIVFNDKWLWDSREYFNVSFTSLLTTGFLKLAGCFCDPEKAYDFENYPALENWNTDSLRQKLGSDYVEYSPFVDKDKWALFVYRVLNLCYVRRVPVYEIPPRYDWGGSQIRRADDTPSEVMERLKRADFVYPGSNQGSSISAVKYDDGSGTVEVEQRVCGFSTLITHPCEVTFYGYAEKGTCDEFSPLGARDAEGKLIRENTWFCAGVAGEPVNNDTCARKTLDFPDSELPSTLPELTYGKVWKKGFDLKKLDISTDSATHNGYAVCNYQNHFKYQTKNGENDQ